MPSAIRNTRPTRPNAPSISTSTDASDPGPVMHRGESADEVVVTWQAVKGAIGYAYKFNDETQWTEVGATC
ncbi:MAG: hypothetical protein ACLRMJ_00320 [Alistipes finegoldii]